MWGPQTKNRCFVWSLWKTWPPLAVLVTEWLKLKQLSEATCLNDFLHSHIVQRMSVESSSKIPLVQIKTWQRLAILVSEKLLNFLNPIVDE
jgi:hypothetical protein